MKLTQAGIDLIKSFEQCRLEVYKDVRGLNTVGWGHRTSLPVGTKITQEQADDWLASDLNEAKQAVDHLVKVQISDNAYSALVSMAYNIGPTELRGSTIIRLVNEQDPKAVDEFQKWDHSGGKVVPGLLRRRLEEAKLFKS